MKANSRYPRSVPRVTRPLKLIVCSLYFNGPDNPSYLPKVYNVYVHVGCKSQSPE